MGLDFNATRFLLHAKAHGVCFAQTVMLGRQTMMLNARALKKNLADFGYLTSTGQAEQILQEANGYAEPFLRLLGATEVRSIDTNDYEQATDIHDFNEPIAERLKNRFSAVLDSGSLEHIFNFPVAIKNCMEVVRIGGHFVAITAGNNFFGHGFYQFSADLLFRIFSTANGFELRQLILFEDSPAARWFEVSDPAVVRARVTLVNCRRTYLAVIAQKVETVPIFAAPPQQSDYTVGWRWGNLEPCAKPRRNSALQLRASVKRLYTRIRKRLFPYDSKHFKRLPTP